MANRFRCELIDQAAVLDLCWRLGEIILASGYRPEVVVAVSRGGFVPARYLCDYLGLLAMTSLKIEHYASGARQTREARVLFPLSGGLEGKRVLLVDDVNDSGDTLLAALAHLRGFSPLEIRSAVMHEKATTRVSADYCAEYLRDWYWIVYPWALFEDLAGFLNAMEPVPGSLAEAAVRLEADYDLRVAPELLARVMARRQLWASG